MPAPREATLGVERGAGQRTPLFRVASLGDLVALAGAALLFAGAVELLVTPAPESAALPVAALLVLAVLAGLQSISGASPLGKFLMAGATGLGGAFLGLGVWLLLPEGLSGLPRAGVAWTLLGAALSLVAMDLLRREAGVGYGALARRAAQLAQAPETQVGALKFLIPWAIVGFLVLVILDLGSLVAGKYAGIFVQYFFNPVGKEVAILCGVQADCFLIPGPDPPIHPLQVAVFLVLIDANTALFLAWNYGHILRVPFFGHALRWIEEHGRKVVAKRRWIRRLAFTGVTLYAAGPFEGTGAIGGTIVGRTIGLDAARTWGAVVSGSILRTTIVTLAVVTGFRVFELLQGRGPAAQAAVLLAVAAALALAGYALWRRRRARAPSPGDAE